MEGMFLRKKFNIWLFLLFLCGLAFIGMYIFLNIVDPEATSELLTFLIVGIMICLVVIPSWFLNSGAFVQISEDSIKAKYHWFGKLNCKTDEIAFAMAQVNTLTIMLKSGKRHVIMGVENAYELSLEDARKACVDAVRKLSIDVGIPQDLKAIVKAEDVDFLSESAYADACRPGNPRDTSVEEIKALYLSLM